MTGACGEDVDEVTASTLLVGVVNLVVARSEAVTVGDKKRGILECSVQLFQGRRSVLLGIVVDKLRGQARVSTGRIATKENTRDTCNSTNHGFNQSDRLERHALVYRNRS